MGVAVFSASSVSIEDREGGSVDGGAGVPDPETFGFGVEPIETGSSAVADAAA